jgi:hypothetical protein
MAGPGPARKNGRNIEQDVVAAGRVFVSYWLASGLSDARTWLTNFLKQEQRTMHIQIRKSVLTRGLVLVAAALALAGCEKGKESGQSLVKVNGTELTVHQLNAELKSSPGMSQPVLLDALVTRQLLVDAAKKDKLDEDPAVLADLQKSRDTILAQAYVARKVAPPSAPTDAEVAQGYKDAPDMFAQRRHYEFSELVIQPGDMNDKIDALMQSKKTLEDVANYLDSQRISYRREVVTRFSGELPVQMAASLRTMELGTLFVVKEPQQTLLVSIQESKPMPVSLSAATPQIRQLLVSKKYNDLVNAQIADLKKSASIEYLPRGEAIRKTAEQAQQDQAAPVKEKAAAPSASANDEQIKRGVAGLK